jgi:hypothetical protein
MEQRPFIDWESLARSVGTLRDDGEWGGSDFAVRALAEILGPDEVRAAVDYFVRSGRGAELARSVLWLLRPWPAMLRCFEIFQTSSEVDARRSAVELLRVVADKRVLPWVPMFLRDADAGTQAWGAGVVDQLLWSNLAKAEECADLLDEMDRHRNDAVRERADYIRKFLRSREGDCSPDATDDGGT